MEAERDPVMILPDGTSKRLSECPREQLIAWLLESWSRSQQAHRRLSSVLKTLDEIVVSGDRARRFQYAVKSAHRAELDLAPSPQTTETIQ